MQKTEHYQLNQWEKTDRILMADFNADNAKIEAALHNTMQQMDEMAANGPKLAFGSYVGTGKYGAANPNMLTLPFIPKLLFIRADLTLEDNAGSCKYCDICMRYGENTGFGSASSTATDWEPTRSLIPTCVQTTWSDCRVSWYHEGFPGKQANYEGITYFYWAIG